MVGWIAVAIDDGWEVRDTVLGGYKIQDTSECGRCEAVGGDVCRSYRGGVTHPACSCEACDASHRIAAQRICPA